MEIDVVCTEDGKTATITATTTSMGSFGDWHPSDGPAEIRNVSQVVTLDGVVVRETERTYYGHTETFTVDLPEGYFIIDGHFLEYWWEKGDDRVVNDPPRMMYYDHDPVNIAPDCGWVEDTTKPVEPEPEPEPEPKPEPEDTSSPEPEGEPEPKPEPEAEPEGEPEPKPEVETEPEPESVKTEVALDQTVDAQAPVSAGDELPPTGSSTVLGVLAGSLVALGGAVILVARRQVLLRDVSSPEG